MTLVPYDENHCREAFQLILDWCGKTGADVEDAFMATTRLRKYCAVAYHGKVYCVMFPEYSSFNPEVIKIHAVISPEGMRSPRAQRAMLDEYVKMLFETHRACKIVAEFPEFAKLTGFIVRNCGFTHEGTFRREWELNGTRYDIHRFGLLKEDFYGQEKETKNSKVSRPY